MQYSTAMTFPLWGLCIFIIWTMLVTIALFPVRLQHLKAGGSPLDYGNPEGNKLVWRMWRTQVNCSENLPLYLGAIVLLLVRGVANDVVNLLVVIYITFRVLHSLIHIFNLDPNFRVACLGIQFLALIGLISSAVVGQ